MRGTIGRSAATCLLSSTLLVLACNRSATPARLERAGNAALPAARAAQATVPAPLPGQPEETPLPQVEVTNLAGESVALRPDSNQVTLINFWATWCVPCLREIPALVQLQSDWGSRGLRVVGIAIESGPTADIRAFALRHGMEYAVLVASQSWARRHFGVIGLPVTLVVDRSGVIRRRLIGPHDRARFELAVREYLERM